VQFVATRRLIDAFAEWGLHEWNGRIQRPALDPNAPEAVLTGINTALWYRAPYRGWRRLATWTDAILADQTKDGEFLRARVASDDKAIGPLVAPHNPPADEGIRPPIVIFDGWHRAATWLAHGRRGLSYAIGADLILTDTVPQLLGDLQP
jgi:hypothetical protein